MGGPTVDEAVSSGLMSGKSTTERLIEAYHTFSRRAAVDDPKARATIFRSLRRALSPWFPADHSAPILDIACGEGALLCLLRSMGYTRLAGFDLSLENVAICHRLGLEFVQEYDALRLASLPESARYGAVFALDLIEHLPKAAAANFLEQVREKLLPGGYVVLQTPNMGSLAGCFHHNNDLSHSFGLTEKTAVDLMLLAGFPRQGIEVRGSWGATTPAGYVREYYLRLLHHVVWVSEGAARPRIASRNLLIRGVR